MVRSSITSTVKAVRLCKIVSRLLGRLGSRCCASTMGAGKSADKVLTKIERASIPPAEEQPPPGHHYSMSRSHGHSSDIYLSFYRAPGFKTGADRCEIS